MQTYAERIVATTGCTTSEAPMVEAWMRLDYGTLDGLDAQRFAVQARRGLMATRAAPQQSAELAKSYGLV